MENNMETTIVYISSPLLKMARVFRFYQDLSPSIPKPGHLDPTESGKAHDARGHLRLLTVDTKSPEPGTPSWTDFVPYRVYSYYSDFLEP